MSRSRPSRQRRRTGSALLETAMVVPILLSLLIGTVELARITYTYYMLQKTMFSLARYVGTQQGVNFCDGEDPGLQAAINFALSGSTESDIPSVNGLTAGMFQIRVERYDRGAQQVVACDCSAAGCDPSQGGGPPGFIVVSLTDGYTVSPVFWGLSIPPFQLRPSVRVPYGGT